MPTKPPVADSHGYETLHIFAGGGQDGAYPNGGLTGTNGTLYGTTAGGRRRGDGTVYKTSTTGNVSVIYHFRTCGRLHGVNPDGPVTMVNGTLYGTTESGGFGYGTVYGIKTLTATSRQFMRSMARTVRRSSDGLLLVGGMLYGTTFDGGTYGNGTVFAVNPSSSGYYPMVLYSLAHLPAMARTRWRA